MATGDIKGTIAQLERCLKHLKYPAAVDVVGLMLGDPRAALPILSFALLKYSRHVAAFILSSDEQLQGKTDEAFVKGAFRLCRDHLGLRTVLTPAQFLEQGFAARKVLLLCDVAQAVRELHAAGVKQERAKQASYRPNPAKQLQQAAAGPPSPRVQRGTALLVAGHLTSSSNGINSHVAQLLRASPGSRPSKQHHKQQQQQEVLLLPSQAGSPAGARADVLVGGADEQQAAVCADVLPSQDQLIEAGLMPIPWWQPQQQPYRPAGSPAGQAAAPPAAAAGAAASPTVPGQAPLPGRAWLAHAGSPAAHHHQQQQASPAANDASPTPSNEQQQQQQQRVTGVLAAAWESPAAALPQEQAWIPVRHMWEGQHAAGPGEPQQPAGEQAHVGDAQPPQQRSWVHLRPQEQKPAVSRSEQQQQQQQQQQRARTCLWPKQQQQQLLHTDHQPAAGSPSAGAIVAVQADEQLPAQPDQQQQLELEVVDQQDWQLPDDQWQQQQQQQLLEAQQAEVHRLAQALARAEAQLQEHRLAAARAEEALTARMTVLEGKVKLLEGQVAAAGMVERISDAATGGGGDARVGCGQREQHPQAAALLGGPTGGSSVATTPGRRWAAAGSREGSARKGPGPDALAWVRRSPVRSPLAAAAPDSPAGGPAAAPAPGRQQWCSGGGGGHTAIDWRAAAAAAASAVASGLRTSSRCSPQPGQPGGGTSKASAAAAAAAAGAAPGSSASGALVPHHASGAAGSTSQLIDQLARRAAEAQSLLETLQVTGHCGA